MSVPVVTFSSDNTVYFDKAIEIRNLVFENEQIYPPQFKKDSLEDLSDHFLLFANGIAVGTCRTRIIEENCMRIEKFAILKDYRSKGYGIFMISEIEKFSKSKGCSRLVFFSPKALENYFIRLGFTPEEASAGSQSSYECKKMMKPVR